MCTVRDFSREGVECLSVPYGDIQELSGHSSVLCALE